MNTESANRSLEVLFTPADFSTLRARDLRRTVCVVFDVLRATSSMITALANGAEAIVPVEDIPEALALRQANPAVLLAGERLGLRIRAPLTGGVDFDLGNSPREYTADRVRGRTIVSTTTNGTRALRACAGADAVLVGCFLNLQATIDWLKAGPPENLLLIASGTFEQTALEDVLTAGAVCEQVWTIYAEGLVSDAAVMARQLWDGMKHDLMGALQRARNGKALLARPDLRDDVPFCIQRDRFPLLAMLQPDGTVRKVAGK